MSDFDSLSYIIYVSDLCTMSYENYVFILYRGMIFILYTPGNSKNTRKNEVFAWKTSRNRFAF